jgi:cytochrome c-type biogenesis protein CcmE
MQHRKLLIGTLAVAAGTLALVFGTARDPRIYSLRLDQFLARDFSDRTVRVRGVLVPGSLCQVTPSCGYRFKLQRSGTDAAAPFVPPRQLSVSYDGCVIPDTFRDVPGIDADVTVEGQRCKTCHDFKAEQIFARTYGGYEMHPHEPPRPVPPIPLCKSKS